MSDTINLIKVTYIGYNWRNLLVSTCVIVATIASIYHLSNEDNKKYVDNDIIWASSIGGLIFLAIFISKIPKIVSWLSNKPMPTMPGLSTIMIAILSFIVLGGVYVGFKPEVFFDSLSATFAVLRYIIAVVIIATIVGSIYILIPLIYNLIPSMYAVKEHIIPFLGFYMSAAFALGAYFTYVSQDKSLVVPVFILGGMSGATLLLTAIKMIAKRNQGSTSLNPDKIGNTIL